MKHFTYCLTSSQLAPTLPSLLDHYYFSDPTYGSTFTYPDTASGCEWTDGPGVSCTYAASADGGLFFPWGYQVQVETRDVIFKDFKGDVSITFNPSGLDTTYHDVFKIVYNFGNGEIRVVERQIISDVISFSLDVFTNANYSIDSPTKIPVTHVFRASSEIVTYTPTITVFYGDMTLVYFNISFEVYPNSIYEVDNVRLINSTQLSEISAGELNVFSIESEETVTCVILDPLSSL